MSLINGPVTVSFVKSQIHWGKTPSRRWNISKYTSTPGKRYTIRSKVVNRIVLTACTHLAWNSALTGGVSSFTLRRRSDLRVTYIDINFCRANSVLALLVMASRLMLSLKKAAAQPKIPWSLKTMTNISWGRSARGGISIPHHDRTESRERPRHRTKGTWNLSPCLD